MLEQEMAHRDFGSVEDVFEGGEREWLLLLVARDEDAAINAQDILSQADEALVMG